jgi:hypothetical protein
MHQGQMVFSQVMDVLPWRRFQTCIDRYHGDTKSHALTTQEFFRIMMFAQLTGRESLSETVLCLNAVPSHLYHLGLPHRLVRSNIAHANHRRNWKIFYDFALILLAEAKAIYQSTPHDFKFDDYPEMIRRVRYIDKETGKSLTFLTNNMIVPPETVALLYKNRWHVELFFKWIKQHLRVKRFFGCSENAVKSQLWIAVCVYALIALLKAKLSLSQTYDEILQILSVTVFEKTPVFAMFAGENYTSALRDSHNQLTLFDL